MAYTFVNNENINVISLFHADIYSQQHNILSLIHTAKNERLLIA